MSTVMPPFPPRALFGGLVLVEVQIDARGTLAEARVLRSAPPFDAPALEASRHWTFRPARRDGQAVAAVGYLVFGFRQPVT
jgi:TonB family protein